MTNAQSIERLSHSVVQIRSIDEKNNGFDAWEFYSNKSVELTGKGSGVIINEKGDLLTSHHVIVGSNRFEVKFADGSIKEAILKRTDPINDLALLRIQSLERLHFISISEKDTLVLGQSVYALGYPDEYGFTVTSGIIAGKGRKINFGHLILADLVQTDHQLSVGSSGGPMINSKGELIGIMTATSKGGSWGGYSFAISLKKIKAFLAQNFNH